MKKYAFIATAPSPTKTFCIVLYLQNTVVCELRDGDSNKNIPSYLPELRAISTRSRAMVTCYPGNGRAYTKHCDNALGNGRKLTSILYVNKDWTPEDGGELQIYPNYDYVSTKDHTATHITDGSYSDAHRQQLHIKRAKSIFGYKSGSTITRISALPIARTSTTADRQQVATATTVAVTIAPIANRLVLFWSDMRCPHEVSKDK